MHKGLKQFGQKGRNELTKEMEQLCRETCFVPISIKKLDPHYKRRAQEDIMILKQKSTTKKTKGRMVFNGKPTRERLSREDTSSPMESLEAILLMEKLMHMRDKIS